MIDLQKALGGFWFLSASKFRDGEVVFYHEKGVSIHPLILFPYEKGQDKQMSYKQTHIKMENFPKMYLNHKEKG